MSKPGQHERPDSPVAAKPSLTPHRKISAGALGSAVAVIALWGIGLTGVDIPGPVAGAITTVIFTVTAYLVPAADPLTVG